MKISIISYAFHGLQRAGVMDVFGYLESVKYRYGLDAADIWSGSLASMEDDYLGKVREALDERELTLACLAVDGPRVWELDPEKRERDHHEIHAYLRAAEVLGAQTVRVDVGLSTADRSSPLVHELGEEQFDWVVSHYAEYAQRAYDNGYRLGPETHFGVELVPENMARIYKAVDSPGYGILLHFGHWVEGREDEGDAMAAPWAMHIHVPGQLDMSRIPEKMAMLRDVGYTGYWGVEHYSGENEYTEVAVQVAQVRDVLDRWRLKV